MAIFLKSYIIKCQKLVRVVKQVNAMQIKDQQKKIILKTSLTDFSRKEKAITSFTRIYTKLNGRDNAKQAKSYFHCGLSTKTVQMY